jgi:diguanylate cyclase (GGDEF)-like protein
LKCESSSYHPFSSGRWIAIYQDVTERRLGIQRLRDSERELKLQNARLDASLDSMPYGFCIWDSDLTLNLWKERFIELYGLDEGSVCKGASLMNIFLACAEVGHFEGRTPREMADYFRTRLNALEVGETFVSEDVLAAGRVVKIGYRRAPDLSFVATHEDITEQRDRLNALKQRESDLSLQNMRFTAAVDNMSQGLCMFDREQRLVICNKRYADIYGLPAELVRPGTSLREILKNRIERGIHPLSGPQIYVQRALDTVADRKPGLDEIELKDGRVIAILHHPMSDGGWVATHQDVTQNRRNEARIRHLARHDGLTDLPNRMLFRERMEQAEACIGRGEIWAVLCIDLDHFKSVNDLLGHAVGDAVLCAVADRLRQSTRTGDVVARLGGDEFAILHGPLHQSKDAAALADRIVKAMAEPFDIARHHILIGASVGIAVAPSDGADGRDPDEERRPRALSRQGRRARRLSLLRAGHGCCSAGASHHRNRPA